MYEEYNCLSFFARIKTKTVLESLKDSLKTYGPVFQFPFYYFYNYFCFPYKIARETKTKKIKEKKDRAFVGNLSRIPKLSLFLF